MTNSHSTDEILPNLRRDDEVEQMIGK